MTRSRSAIAVLLMTALCCAGCVSSLWVTDPTAHELEVVELSEAQMQHGSSAAADKKVAETKLADNSGKPTADDKISANPTANGPASAPPSAGAASAAAPMSTAPTAAAPQVTSSPDTVPQSPPPQTAASAGGAAKQIDSRQMLALLTDLQAAGAIDPASQQELLNDLKQTDPALWPQLIRQFRTALAYRQHLAGATPGAATTAAQGSTATPPGAAISATGVPATASSPTDPLAAMFGQSQESAAKSVGNLTKPGDSLLGPPIASIPASASAAMIARASFNGDIPATDSTATAQSIDPPAAPTTNPNRSAEHPDKSPANPAPRAITKSTAAKPTKPAAQTMASKATDEWQQQLTESILAIEGQTAGEQLTPADIDRQLRLRFLYLAAGRRDDALRPIQGLPPEQQEFWTKELYGLGTYLDAERIADPERRATQAALHLHDAVGRLGEMASPVVHNLTFCKEVSSFGVFKRFPKYEFKPAEEVLLYCEIENLKSQSTDLGFHTAIKSSYQILDSRGERVSEQEFPPSDDYCSNPRRDFFIPYFIALPKRINPGNYTLQLTIEDTQRNKVGQSSIQFTVK